MTVLDYILKWLNEQVVKMKRQKDKDVIMYS